METEPATQPRHEIIWAVRSVPVLLVFAAVDLLQRNPPVSFLVLTMVQLVCGVATLVAIHKKRRDLLALGYVVLVFLTSLVHPVRSGQLLLLATLSLLVIGGDRLWRRLRVRDSSPETG